MSSLFEKTESQLKQVTSLKDPEVLKKQLDLRMWNGPLTEELLQKPNQFGLGNIPKRVDQTKGMVKSICGFCSTGCSLTIHVDKDKRSNNLSPTGQYPVNLGMACPKGWEALTVTDAPNRAKAPLFASKKGGPQEEISWQDAAQIFTDRMKETQEKHGKHSVAFISTGQIPFEEMAFLGSFFKFGMGGLHCDGNTRQCMATSVVSYKQAFGFDAPPYTYADFEESDHLVFIGANPCIAHPIMWQRVLRNKRNPEITVVDPRWTETAACATNHLGINPKSDQTFFYGVANYLFENNLHHEKFLTEHVNGWQEYREFVQEFTLEKVSEETGIEVEAIIAFAKQVADQTKRTSFWWTMGVNQSHQGVRTAQAIINLALMTGNIGKPGTGANSITGQCNAMGSRLFSNTTGLLGGHDFANEDHRNKVAQHLDIPVENIPSETSWAYNRIIDGIRNGEIKALWVIATNPAHSWINQNEFHELREKLDFLVVQDMYADTETAKTADLVLPAAAWSEKDGCFINSERRIGTIRQINQAPGQALSDFRILRLLAETWGCGDLFKHWTSPQAAFDLLKGISKGQPCDITGIEGYEYIEAKGGIQWPFRAHMENDSTANERRLFEDGKFYHADGKAKMLFEAPRPEAEQTNGQFPYYLNTGRGSSSQWHTQSRTKNSAVLRKLYPADPYAEISEEDAKLEGLKDQDWMYLESLRGKIKVRAFIAPTVKPGHIFLPMHDGETNKLTYPSFDPYSHQPSYKTGAVRVEKV